MKLGVCLEMFFQDSPFLDRIAKAGDAGFRFAEMWFVDATAWSPDNMNADDPKDPGRVAAAAEKAGVTLTNAVIGSPDGSLGGGLTNPNNREQWLARADTTLGFCKEAGIGACIVCTGNHVNEMRDEDMRHSVVEGLKATAEKAEAAGIDLWLEPLNDKIDHPGYFCTGSDQGADLCRAAGSPRVKMLYDCYHMQIMEGDLTGHLDRHVDAIGHIHAAGHPGRHELWLGEIYYPFLLKDIEQRGYQGVVAMEYLPTLPSDESLRRTRRCLEEA